MIGWWATDVCSGGRCEEYGPSTPLPHGAQWVKELHSDVTIEAATKDGRDRVEPYDAVVREVQPAWLDVQAVKHTSSQPHDYAATAGVDTNDADAALRTAVDQAVATVNMVWERAGQEEEAGSEAGSEPGSDAGSDTGAGEKDRSGSDTSGSLRVPWGCDQRFWLCTRGSKQYREHLLESYDPWSSDHALASGQQTTDT